MTHIDELFLNKTLNEKAIEGFRINRQLTIHLSTSCNLGCSYCTDGKSGDLKGPTPAIIAHGLEYYLKRLEILLKDITTLSILFIGEGEVLTSPCFIPVFQWMLNRNYRIGIQTNLHGENYGVSILEKALEPFSKEQRKRVAVGTSYHLGAYYDKFPNLKSIRENYVYNWYKRLSETGVCLSRIEVPMTPQCINDPDLDKEFEYMASLGGYPCPSALVGHYKGKKYPESYTPNETAQLNQIFQKWRKDNPGIYNRTEKWTKEQIPHIKHQIYLKGKPCYKRMSAVDILANGDIRFCMTYPKWWIQGNLFRDPLPSPLFLERAEPCPQEACGCDSIGVMHCLIPFNISTKDYYRAYYLDKNQIDIANLFK